MGASFMQRRYGYSIGDALSAGCRMWRTTYWFCKRLQKLVVIHWNIRYTKQNKKIIPKTYTLFYSDLNFNIDYSTGAAASCNGDTWASELGTVFGNTQPFLITTRERVPKGCSNFKIDYSVRNPTLRNLFFSFVSLSIGTVLLRNSL